MCLYCVFSLIDSEKASKTADAFSKYRESHEFTDMTEIPFIVNSIDISKGTVFSTSPDLYHVLATYKSCEKLAIINYEATPENLDEIALLKIQFDLLGEYTTFNNFDGTVFCVNQVNELGNTFEPLLPDSHGHLIIILLKPQTHDILTGQPFPKNSRTVFLPASVLIATNVKIHDFLHNEYKQMSPDDKTNLAEAVNKSIQSPIKQLGMFHMLDMQKALLN